MAQLEAMPQERIDLRYADDLPNWLDRNKDTNIYAESEPMSGLEDIDSDGSED